MAKRDIVVIGASAGGVQALQRLCAALPADLPAAVFVVQHLSPTARSMLPHLLERAGQLPATTPQDGDAVEHGRIHVAGPDRHMLLRPGTIWMRRGPHENRTRPAVDALFRSAALAYGARVIGVVLTGLLDDGTEGLIAIKAAGGMSLVQDPQEAEWPSMPRSALARDHVDHALTIEGLAEMIARLVREDAPPSQPLPHEFEVEDNMAAKEFAVMDSEIVTPGQPSHISCPDCGGVLNAIEGSGDLRFRCQVGHAFTVLGLAEAQSEELERALGIAVRTHRDRMKLFDQMGARAQAGGLTHSLARWRSASAESRHLAEVLERAMANLHRTVVDGDAAEVEQAG